MKKCIVIYNPNSGRGIHEKILKKVKEILLIYGYESNIMKSEYKGHAIDIVKNLEKVDLVISIGGDGTFNESMTGNFERKDTIISGIGRSFKYSGLFKEREQRPLSL